MKPESIPFYAIGVAILLGAAWFLNTYEGYTFEDPDGRQFCKPQVEVETFRWGKEGGLIEPSEVEPGMLVRYRSVRSSMELTSRVAATEGQRVKIDEGKLFVDGKLQKDDYAYSKSKKDFLPELIVPRGCVFVLNDQRQRRGSDRLDSRALGPIHLGSVRYAFTPIERKDGRRR